MGDEMEAIRKWRAKLAPQKAIVPVRPERQCRNKDGKPKARHRLKHQATASLNAIRAKPGFVELPDRPVHVFKCQLCNYWHVGRTPPKEKP